MNTTERLDEEWKQLLENEYKQPYFAALKAFLQQEKNNGKIIYPKGAEILNAFYLTPYTQVKAVIIGQDPYHGHGQAHGLCFSVNDGVAHPPSLQNIFKELQADCGIALPISGNLTKWAKQGVLMLNATLTVEKDKAGSHQHKGWEIFTDHIIQHLSEQKNHLVFILWGKFAQSKSALIDANKHCILKAAHPSPFSAYSGFFGCRHFSKTNEYLQHNGIESINWQL